MKQLQKSFTTSEQGRRLLALGVPADSADLGRVEDIMHGGVEVLQVPYQRWCKGYENVSTPCWSVGRLIEIELLCREKKEGLTARLSFTASEEPIEGSIACENIVEGLVATFESRQFKYDFSRLEE